MRFIFILFSSIFIIIANAQVTASFVSPDSVCIGSPLVLNNTSKNASSFLWSFCATDLNKTPTATQLGNVGNLFAIPVFMDYVFVNGNYYGFLVNNGPGGLIRLDFGNSLLNTPTSLDLGDFGGIIPNSAQGIQLIKNGTNWLAIIVGGDPLINISSRIIKVDFGLNVTNTNPQVTNWGNIGGLNYPVDIYVFQEGLNWYGITVNYRDNTFTRFNFGPNFNNTPIGTNLGNIGNMSLPSGIFPINDNGVWRVFIANYGNNTLSRIDFSNSLLNPPSNAVNLGNVGNTLNTPRDVLIFKNCDQINGFVINDNSGDIVRLDFNTLSNVPSAISLGKVGGTSNPHSISKIFREGADIYTFLPNSQINGLTRLKFSGCNDPSLPNSNLASPQTIVYKTQGTYNINLIVDEGMPTQTSFCKSIKVIPPPILTVSNDTSICIGDSIMLFAQGGMNYQWTPSTGLSNINISNPIATPSLLTKYIVSSSIIKQCSSTDTIVIDIIPKPIYSLTPASSNICPGDSVSLQINGGGIYQWLTNPAVGNINDSSVIYYPQNSAVYKVIAASKKCNFIDTLRSTTTIKTLPIISVSKSNDIDCNTSAVQLIASGGVKYLWTPNIGLSNDKIPNPTSSISSNIKYQVEVTGSSGCKAIDSININVFNSNNSNKYLGLGI